MAGQVVGLVQVPSGEYQSETVAVDVEAWDVAVIGAGPAGSVCACSALAASPRLRVALVDMEAFPRDKACGDAIQVDAADLLRELGCGAVFDSRPLVSRAARNFPAALSRFGAGQYLQSHYIIEREIFDNHLFSGALRRGAGDFSEHRFVDATFDAAAGLWRLTLTRRSGARMELRCAVLVGADGPSSRVRRLVAVERQRPAHTAVALRAYAQAEGLDVGAIRLDFLRSLLPGYAWTFPLVGPKVNIGVAVQMREYKRAGRRLESYLHEYLEHLADDGVRIRDMSDVDAHPLPLASQAVALAPHPRAALVGDAAAMVNPFTGEGIHYGIWAGHALGRAIGSSANANASWQAALASYAQAYAEEYGEHMKAYVGLRDIIRLQGFLNSRS